MTIALISLGLLVCICFSGIFSASEMAFSSCNIMRLENALKDGEKRASKALKITGSFDNALSAILIGNNLVNIAASSLGSVLIFTITGSTDKTWIATVVITVLVIIFGETIPKISAKKNANRYALSNAWFIRILMIILKPLIFVVVKLVDLLTSGMKDDDPSQGQDEVVEELQSIIETAEDEGVLDKDKTELVNAAIDFSDISASEVMTARVDMEAIDIDDDFEDICKALEETPYSRIPVYRDSIDNIIGILHLNHFFRAMTDEGHVDIEALLMEPCFVYKTTKLPSVLNQLKNAKQHLAIVTDEYSGTLGVISMEDVLEQIVGEIWDETDEVEEEVIVHNDSEFEVDGDMAISDFLELLNISEEAFDYESETAGGWSIEMLDRFPESGEGFEFRNFEVTVLEVEGRRVVKLLVKRNEEADASDEPGEDKDGEAE